jgi:hypothetical protein
MGLVLISSKRRIIGRLLVAAVVAGVLAGAWIATREGDERAQGIDPSGVALAGVNLDELAENGVELSEPPHDYVPRVSAADAATEATKWRGAAPIGSALVHLKRPGFEGEAWAINLDPSYDQPRRIGLEGQTLYHLAFISANTGEFMFFHMVEAPPPGGWPTEPPPNYVDPAK